MSWFEISLWSSLSSIFNSDWPTSPSAPWPAVASVCQNAQNISTSFSLWSFLIAEPTIAWPCNMFATCKCVLCAKWRILTVYCTSIPNQKFEKSYHWGSSMGRGCCIEKTSELTQAICGNSVPQHPDSPFLSTSSSQHNSSSRQRRLFWNWLPASCSLYPKSRANSRYQSSKGVQWRECWPGVAGEPASQSLGEGNWVHPFNMSEHWCCIISDLWPLWIFEFLKLNSSPMTDVDMACSAKTVCKLCRLLSQTACQKH